MRLNKTHKRSIKMTIIIGIYLENRIETALEFQRILTEYGCSIRTRIGLHPSSDDVCLNRGIVLLELQEENDKLITELSKHWQIQTMKF